MAALLTAALQAGIADIVILITDKDNHFTSVWSVAALTVIRRILSSVQARWRLQFVIVFTFIFIVSFIVVHHLTPHPTLRILILLGVSEVVSIYSTFIIVYPPFRPSLYVFEAEGAMLL